MVSLGLAALSGLVAVFLHWSLQGPHDWSAHWSADDEITDDRSLHQAVLTHGARLGPGLIGGGVHFTEAGSSVDLDNWIPSGAWTIDIWVRLQELPSDTTVIAGATTERKPGGLGIFQGAFGALHLDPHGDQSWIRTAIRPSTNRWYHLATTYDGRVTTLYVDGRKEAEAASHSGPMHEGNTGMLLGACRLMTPKGWIPLHSFRGRVDEPMVFPRALSAAELGALHRNMAVNPTVRRLSADLAASVCLALLITAVFWPLAALGHRGFPDAVNALGLARSYRAVAAVMVAGLAITGCLSLGSQRQLEDRERRRFHRSLTDFMDQFDSRTESYLQQMTFLARWLGDQSDLTRAEWDLAVNSLNLAPDCPGLFSVGFAPAVSPDRLTAFETWARQRIEPDFQVHWVLANSNRWVVSASGCSNSSALFPLTFHSHIVHSGEPVGERPTDWGRDLFNFRALAFQDDQMARDAVWVAHRTQRAISGGWGELLPASGNHPSVRGTRVFLGVSTTRPHSLLSGGPYWPVDAGGRQRFGVLFAAFDWQEFFDSGLRSHRPAFRFSVSQSEALGNGRTTLATYDPSPTTERRGSTLRSSYQARFYWSRLHFEFEALPEFFDPSARRWPLAIAGLGTALSLGVAGLIAIQVRARLIEAESASQLRLSRDQLRHLLQDRERISRDLHDGTIQSIYAIGLGLKRCHRFIEQDPALARRQLTDSLGELDGAIAELRHFILGLEPELPGGESFASILRSLVERTRRTCHAEVLTDLDPGIDTDLSPWRAIHLINLIREALSNCVRHADAGSIKITLRRQDDQLTLRIADNGVGFEPDARASSGRGLGNLKARAEALQGTFSLRSSAGAGTEITVIFPREEPPAGTPPTKTPC